MYYVKQDWNELMHRVEFSLSTDNLLLNRAVGEH